MENKKVDEVFVIFLVVNGQETERIIKFKQGGVAICDYRDKETVESLLDRSRKIVKDLNKSSDDEIGAVGYTFKRDKFVSTF